MSIALVRGFYRTSFYYRKAPSYQGVLKFYSGDSGSQKVNKAQEPTALVDKNQLQNKYSRQNVRANVEGYFFPRFFQYVSKYPDKILQEKFPSAIKVYRVFLVGVKDFFSDMKMYLKISRIVNSSTKGLRALTRKELELYNQIPKDMVKVAPVLLSSALPFASYVIFPLAYMYPRQLLTSHFWDPEQKTEFQQRYLKERTAKNRKLFRCLQAKLKFTYNSGVHTTFNYILGLLGSGTHPTAEEILSVKQIFSESPYNLNSLSSKHLKYLCRLHGIHSLYLKRVRLSERAYTLHHMDLAIKNEGGVHNLPSEALKTACYIRGLNPVGLSNDEMIEWLQEFVKVSLQINTSNISLYLHLPLLFSYNHHNNWRLSHK